MANSPDWTDLGLPGVNPKFMDAMQGIVDYEAPGAVQDLPGISTGDVAMKAGMGALSLGNSVATAFGYGAANLANAGLAAMGLPTFGAGLGGAGAGAAAGTVAPMAAGMTAGVAALPLIAIQLAITIKDMLEAKEAQPTGTDVHAVKTRLAQLNAFGEAGQMAAKQVGLTDSQAWIKFMSREDPSFARPDYMDKMNNPSVVWNSNAAQPARAQGYKQMGQAIEDTFGRGYAEDPAWMQELLGDPRMLRVGSHGDGGNWGFGSYSQGEGYRPSDAGDLFRIANDPNTPWDDAAVTNLLTPVVSSYQQAAGPGQGAYMNGKIVQQQKEGVPGSGNDVSHPRFITDAQAAAIGTPEWLADWTTQAVDPYRMWIADEFDNQVNYRYDHTQGGDGGDGGGGGGDGGGPGGAGGGAGP